MGGPIYEVQMKECAFCDHKGKLSAEHIVSDWMEELFPGELRIRYSNATKSLEERKADRVDWKAKVVCEKCNNTWMSRIETNHAQPVMTPLITGKIGIPIGPVEARSLALFAFKTAVVLDHITGNPDHISFFSREARHSFRQTLQIPPQVQMWLAGFANHRGGGRFLPLYHQGQFSPTEYVEMYICTFAIGNLAIQMVAVRNPIRYVLEPKSGFESLAVPLWPDMWPGYIWPGVEQGAELLTSVEQFREFAGRWSTVGAYM
jgi:hypothetical protein